MRFSWTAEAGFAFTVLACVLLWGLLCKHAIGGQVGAFLFAWGVLSALGVGIFWALGFPRRYKSRIPVGYEVDDDLPTNR